MSITTGLEEYKVNMFEYAHLVATTGKWSDSFQLYIPKLMALFPRADPKRTNYVFNNNIFVNDAECKPATGKAVTTQNYITVKRHFDRDFSARASNLNYIAAGTRFIVHVMDENIRDMRISDVV